MSGTRRQHVWGAGLLALPVLALLWAALIKGQVLTSDSALYGLAPWSPFAPSDVSHYLNSLLTDIPEYHYPWAHYVRENLHAGTIPTWNSFALSGTPFYANSQSGLTSITDIPLWVLPLNYGFGVVAALKLWIGGAGAYFLARQLRLGFWAGLLAGVCYPLAAFNIGWLEHMTLVASTAWLPWEVLAIERMLRRPTLRVGLGLTAVAALIIDGGHPGTEVQALGAAAVYTLARALTIETLTPRERLQRVIFAGGATAVGGLLMMFIVVPVLEAAAGTQGGAVRSGGGGILPLSSLRTIFFPDWWGRPSQGYFGGPSNYVQRNLYDGVVGILLAGLALTLRRGWRYKLPLALMGVIGPAVAFGVPGVHDLVVSLPLFGSVNADRMIFWFPFAVAMLSASGLQDLVDDVPGVRSGALCVVTVAVLIAIGAVVLEHPPLFELLGTLHHFQTGTNYKDAYVLALTSVGWWSIFVGAAGLAIWLMFRVPRARVMVPALLVVLAALDMHHFAAGLDPIGPASKIIPPTPPSVKYLQRNAGLSRVVGFQGALVADYNMVYHLREPTGLDPPQPTKRYFDLWRLANPSQATAFGLTLPDTLSLTGLRVLSLLGVRYLLTPPNTPGLANPGLAVVYRGTDLTVYRNPAAVAPAFVPSALQSVSSDAAALTAIASADFAPKREALLDTGSAQAGSGLVSLSSDTGATARMTTKMMRAGLVVRNDAWARGWSVRIDGKSARLLRVNDVMQGVEVPAGHHTIVFTFRVPGLALGLALSVTGILTLISGLGVCVIRRRRPTEAVS